MTNEATKFPSENIVRFVVPGEARGKQRPRATKGGRMYTPAETVNAEAHVKMQAFLAMDGKPPMKGPLTAHFAVTVGVPASWSKKKQQAALIGDLYPTGKPDLDNIVKLFCDAMNGVVYDDDKQIVSLTVSKFYGDVAQTAISVREVRN